MSSLLNSEKMPSPYRNETRTFEKYGVTFSYGVTIEERPKWDRMLRLADGTFVPQEGFDPDKHKDQLPANGQLVAEWVKCDEVVQFETVAYCMVQDDEYCTTAKPLEMHITADGQIMGIGYSYTDDEIILLDPCVITYSSRTNAIGYQPIFGVQRSLRLKKSAIRATVTPAELLISGYPGFLIQNRMYRYQLKPAMAFNTTQLADNDATPVETKTV